jgi:TPR repeat protein
LGAAYETGDGVRQDFSAASRWYRKAADRGYPPAQNNMGGLYEAGAGVRQDQQQAVQWYRLAAGQGHSGACLNLARAYASGKGVTLEAETAYFWAVLASDRQSDVAGLSLEQFTQQLRGRITAADAGRVEAQVEDWRRSHPLSQRGVFLVKLSTGPSYIATSPVTISAK